MSKRIKLFSSVLMLALTVCWFTACGGMGATLDGATLALEAAGAEVLEIEKATLPETFSDHQTKVKTACRVTKGDSGDLYLVEFNTASDAIAAYPSIGSNKQRAGLLIMYSESDVTSEGNAKAVWDAFTAYANGA